MTDIGALITGAIPDDVTEFADRDTGTANNGTKWGRWVLNPSKDHFGWCMADDIAERYRTGQSDTFGTIRAMFTSDMEHLRPFRVLAVKAPTPVLQRVEVPTAPDGWTRVKDRDGDPWEIDDDGRWNATSRGARIAVSSTNWTWAKLLGTYGPLTNDTPPREPRVWLKVDVEAVDLDGVNVVDVEGHGRWIRWPDLSSADGQVMFKRGNMRVTLLRLRTLGEVREVLGE